MTLLRTFITFTILITGCAGPPAREISGQVQTKMGAVVVAQSAAGRTFVAPLDARGLFRLSVPAGETYRLVVAQRAPEGLAVLARLRWPLPSRPLWARVAGGPPLRLAAAETFEPGPELGDVGSGDDSPASPPAMCPVGEADLPYDVKLALGATFRLTDAFREKGPLPQAVLEVTMDGGDWRLAELRADAPYVVTQADCDHDGNRDRGRDRIFVTWRNADGSTETDHLDLRYCEEDGGGSSGPSTSSLEACEDDGGTTLCEDSKVHDVDCHGDDDGLEPAPGPAGERPACAPIL